MWKNGQLPSVKVGIYGDILTEKNISLEHIIPKSLGGKSDFSNYALATKEKNYERNSANIFLFTTEETILDYLDQFKNIMVIDFNGNKYIEQILQTLNKLKRRTL